MNKRFTSAYILLFLFCFIRFANAASHTLLIDNPTELQALEQQGLSFAELVTGQGNAQTRNDALYQTSLYRSIVDSLRKDLNALKADDKHLGTGMQYGHRLFDPRWFTAESAHYELVGIINRLDRAAFYRNESTCGELRFIYRLAYQTVGENPIYSRLPMTVNVVFLLPGTNCKQWATTWQRSPFNPEDWQEKRLKSVEVNLQSVRWPSTVRPGLGGYAEYFLRVFHRQGDRFHLAALENTPDINRLKRDSRLKKRLLTWLVNSENIHAIDQGVVQIPEEFLAKRVTSVALNGSHRLANMPFNQLFDEQDFRQIDFSQRQYVRSPLGYLKRLNDLSCSGCHQGRTTAGFHFLGVDRPQTDSVNAIAVAASPHFLLDQPRRQDYQRTLLNQQAVNISRPLSLRADQGEGGIGSHCGLGDTSFSSWTCNEGLSCQAITLDNALNPTGICQPATPMAGSACQISTIKHNANPHWDRQKLQQTTSCGTGSVCEQTKVGFPGGMCSRSNCDDLSEGETCGSIAILYSFNQCLAARKPFASCLKRHVRPAALQACDAKNYCRDDYVCAKTQNSDRGQGGCIPPYFLFQLRGDGHPALY